MLERIIGSIGGLDVAVWIAVARYAFTGVLQVRDWYAERRQMSVFVLLAESVQWAYVNLVQPLKKRNGSLSLEEGVNALAAASSHAVQLAKSRGVDLEKEVGDVPAAVQGVFARFKASLKPAGRDEVEAGS